MLACTLRVKGRETMSPKGKFILEVLRVVAVYVVVSGLITHLIIPRLGLDLSSYGVIIKNLIIFLLVAIWYRKKGQYTGWYKKSEQ